MHVPLRYQPYTPLFPAPCPCVTIKIRKKKCILFLSNNDFLLSWYLLTNIMGDVSSCTGSVSHSNALHMRVLRSKWRHYKLINLTLRINDSTFLENNPWQIFLYRSAYHISYDYYYYYYYYYYYLINLI